VTVETNSFLKTESLTQRCVCVGCQLNSDQTLRLLCLKRHVRARLDAETKPVVKKQVNSCALKHPLFEGVQQQHREYSIRRATNVRFSKKPGNALSDALLMWTLQKTALRAVF